MKPLTRTRSALTICALALLIAGCDRTPQVVPLPYPPGSAPGAKSPVSLRTYSVPAGQRPAAYDALRALLTAGDKIGSVRMGPSGTLMVLTTGAIHEGVASFVAELQKAPPAAAPEAKNVVGRYWFVEGRLGEGEDDPALAPIAQTLKAIEQRQGPMIFSLVEQVQVRSSAGDRGSAIGRAARVMQSLVALPGGALKGRLELSLNDQRAETKTEINVRYDQDLVLGQAGLGSRQLITADGAPTSARDGLLLYIARFSTEP